MFHLINENFNNRELSFFRDLHIDLYQNHHLNNS